MVFTVCVPQLPHAGYVTVSSRRFMLLEWIDVKFVILRKVTVEEKLSSVQWFGCVPTANIQQGSEKLHTT